MCGFTGFIDYSGFSNSNYEEILENCHKDLFFRGPDQNNKYIDYQNNIYINFDRLSFFDLSSEGIQPMKSLDRRYLIIMNGEIYNFSNLRNTLQKYNYKANYNSDTSVSLEYISRFGLELFLKNSLGMYSIVLIDFYENKIHFISDEFSQKPLYYSLQNNILYFSSDIRTINSNSKFKLEINKRSIKEYFLKSYISSPNTIYNNVYKLEPSSNIIFSLSNKNIDLYKKKKYNKFNLPLNKNINSKPNIKKIKKIIEKSTLLHLESDVPIGTFLSSGIDSSLITSIASQHKKKINAFSLGFKNNTAFDESSHAEKISNHLGISHHIHYFDKKTLEEKVLNSSEVYSEPFADSSQILYNDLCEFSSVYVKGILSGDGADELFGGYHRHLTGSRIYKVTRNILIQKLFVFLINISENKIFKNIIDYLGYTYSHEKILRLRNAILAKDLNHFYDLITSHISFIHIVNDINDLDCNQDMFSDVDYSKYLMWKDLNFYLPNDLLVKSDRASMYHSLEVRSPFLNLELINEIKNIKSQYMFQDFKTKAILKNILKDYLPSNLISNQKKGFNSPINSWLKKELQKLIDHYTSSKMLSHDILNKKIIEKNMNDFKNGKNNYFEIWNLLIFQIWHNKYH